jgi:predicted amidohydrolase
MRRNSKFDAMKKNRLIVAAAQMVFRAKVGENVEWIVKAIGSSAAAGADVILFPECAITGYNRDFAAINRAEIDQALKRVADAARQARCNVLVGSPTFAGRKRFNSLIVFDRRGREVFRYSKIHLTARDRRYFSPGNKLAFFKLDGVPCTAMICHERRFPELVRLPVMLGAQVVFHPNAGLDKLAVSYREANARAGTGSSPALLKTKSSTFSPIPLARKAMDYGRRATRKSSVRIAARLPWRTTAMK